MTDRPHPLPKGVQQAERLPFRKSYEVVGVTTDDGSIICLPCYQANKKEFDEPQSALFLDDTDGTEVCDTCTERLDT